MRIVLINVYLTTTSDANAANLYLADPYIHVHTYAKLGCLQEKDSLVEVGGGEGVF